VFGEEKDLLDHKNKMKKGRKKKKNQKEKEKKRKIKEEKIIKQKEKPLYTTYIGSKRKSLRGFRIRIRPSEK